MLRNWSASRDYGDIDSVYYRVISLIASMVSFAASNHVPPIFLTGIHLNHLDFQRIINSKIEKKLSGVCIHRMLLF